MAGTPSVADSVCSRAVFLDVGPSGRHSTTPRAHTSIGFTHESSGWLLIRETCSRICKTGEPSSGMATPPEQRLTTEEPGLTMHLPTAGGPRAHLPAEGSRRRLAGSWLRAHEHER